MKLLWALYTSRHYSIMDSHLAGRRELDTSLEDQTHKILKVWSTVKIRRTRVPKNSITPVGRSRPYSIIIPNMRFIPKASLRASSQITASSYILE